MKTITGNALIILFILSGILKAQDHENIEQVNSLYTMWETALDISAVDDYLYVATGVTGLFILNIAEFDQIEIAARLELPQSGSVLVVTVANGLAYIGCESGLLYIMDVSNPVEPRELSRIDVGRYCTAVTVVENVAYVGRGYSLVAVDISDPEDPEIMESIRLYVEPLDIEVRGSVIYVAGGAGNNDSLSGIRTIDISDPRRFEELDSYNTPGLSKGIALRDSFALVADYRDGVRIIDISDPGNVIELDFIDTPGYSKDVNITGDLLFLANGQAGMRVYDISDMDNITEIALIDSVGIISEVEISGDLAYICGSDRGVGIIDISGVLEGEEPVELGGFNNVGQIVDVDVRGDYLYTTQSGAGLSIADITDVNHPFEVGFCEEINIYDDVIETEISGDLAFGRFFGYMNVIDITEPDNPRLIERYSTGYI